MIRMVCVWYFPTYHCIRCMQFVGMGNATYCTIGGIAFSVAIGGLEGKENNGVRTTVAASARTTRWKSTPALLSRG